MANHAAARFFKTLESVVHENDGRLAYRAFADGDFTAAKRTEPLEQVIDTLKKQLRTRHILRLQKGECPVDAGFVWSDLLTGLERVSSFIVMLALARSPRLWYNDPIPKAQPLNSIGKYASRTVGLRCGR